MKDIDTISEKLNLLLGLINANRLNNFQLTVLIRVIVEIIYTIFETG